MQMTSTEQFHSRAACLTVSAGGSSSTMSGSGRLMVHDLEQVGRVALEVKRLSDPFDLDRGLTRAAPSAAC